MPNLPTLYKVSKSGSIEQWDISFNENEDGAYYEIEYGMQNGAVQVKRNYVAGKNIGRANETSDLEQAKLEAISRWKKQLDKGYSKNQNKIENEIILPMLAHDYSKHKHKVKYPCFMQPKLDGVRCLARKQNGETILLSRKNKEYNLPHISSILNKFFINDYENWILDGELYIHDVSFDKNGKPVRNTSFQTLMSWIKRHQTDSLKVEYHVYDIISDEPFETRLKKLRALNGIDSKIKVVDTYSINKEADVNLYYTSFFKNGYEGGILRHSNDGYEKNYRSYNLLKVKNFITEEFEVIGAEENSKSLGQCSFILTTKGGGVFKAKPEGSVEYREYLWQNHKQYIGKQATVKYFEMTDSEPPVPRFPIIVDIDRSEVEGE